MTAPAPGFNPRRKGGYTNNGIFGSDFAFINPGVSWWSFFDNFQRPDSDTLGAPWQNVTGEDPLAISDETAVPTANPSGSGACIQAPVETISGSYFVDIWLPEVLSNPVEIYTQIGVTDNTESTALVFALIPTAGEFNQSFRLIAVVGGVGHALAANVVPDIVTPCQVRVGLVVRDGAAFCTFNGTLLSQDGPVDVSAYTIPGDFVACDIGTQDGGGSPEGGIAIQQVYYTNNPNAVPPLPPAPPT